MYVCTVSIFNQACRMLCFKFCIFPILQFILKMFSGSVGDGATCYFTPLKILCWIILGTIFFTLITFSRVCLCWPTNTHQWVRIDNWILSAEPTAHWAKPNLQVLMCFNISHFNCLWLQQFFIVSVVLPDGGLPVTTTRTASWSSVSATTPFRWSTPGPPARTVSPLYIPYCQPLAHLR